MAARVAVVYLVVGEPDFESATECKVCLFDAVLTFPLTAITEEGVGPFGSIRACVRCYEDGQS